VHRQSFPKLGEPHAYLTSAVSKRGVDVSGSYILVGKPIRLHPQTTPIHRQSFEEILPTLKQLLQGQALSRRSPPVAQQLSVRPEYPAPSDHRSRSAFMSPHASHPSLPQCPDLNTTPAHPDHAETLVSLPSHAISLASELMSRSPSPLVISHNLTSLAQLPPDSQLTSVPSGDPLVHSAGSSTPINSSLDHPQLETRASNIALRPAHATPYSAAHSIRRVEHKIRGLDQVVHWFDSHGCEPLLTPPPCEPLECGDLYIHQSLSAPTARQMWIWSAKRCWEDARENQVHPFLPMHRLWLGANGEPRWVTQKTVSTYKGRGKVSGRARTVVHRT
jgi:hypothetical protein